MTQQQKHYLTALISLITLIIVYVIVIYTRRPVGTFHDPASTAFWSWSVLGLIPVMLLSQLMAFAVSSVLIRSIDKEDVEMIEDEMDHLIDAKAVKLSYYILSAGIIVTLGGIALVGSVNMGILILGLSIILSGMAGIAYKWRLYMRGI